MPRQRCESEGKPGYKWGDAGTCYTYTPGDKASKERAKAKVEEQRKAIEASKHS